MVRMLQELATEEQSGPTRIESRQKQMLNQAAGSGYAPYSDVSSNLRADLTIPSRCPQARGGWPVVVPSASFRTSRKCWEGELCFYLHNTRGLSPCSLQPSWYSSLI